MCLVRKTACSKRKQEKLLGILVKMRLTVLSLAATLALVGCTTPQYDLAREQCRREAANKYPPNLQNRVVQNSHLVKVPDGTSRCTTEQFGNRMVTNCQQGTKLIRQYYNETIVVDLNRQERGRFVNKCTVRVCIDRYGNSECKPAESKSMGTPNISLSSTTKNTNRVRSTLTNTEKIQDGKWKCTYKTASFKDSTFVFISTTSCPFVVMYDENKKMVYTN